MKKLMMVLCCCLLSGVPASAQNLEDVAAQPYQDRPLTGAIPSSSPTSTGNAVVQPSGSAAGPAPASSASGGEYAVCAGDNLSAIARRLLGDPKRFWEIVRLNADRYPSLAKNPNLILVGWKLKLPGSAAVNTPEPVVPVVAPTTGAVAQTPVSAPIAETPVSAQTSSSGRPPVAAPVPPVEPGVSAPGQSSGPLFSANSRVLHIGDSHTVGIYGKAIDGMIRDTGAKVQTYGVAGSSPSWWLNGTTTKCGYYSKDDKGKVDSPADWRTPRQTPDFKKLIADFKPNVIVISLGANMLGASDSQIKKQVQSLLDVAKAAGTTIVWVGPPDGRESKKPTTKQTALYNSLKTAVGDQATFIDSRPYTDYPETGGDGVHYWGTEGTRIAKGWAQQVFDAAQKSPKP